MASPVSTLTFPKPPQTGGGLTRRADELSRGPDGFFPIDSYCIVGDLHTCALVSPEGGIDWMCAPVFDSPSLFTSILDLDSGGSFSIAPRGLTSVQPSYLAATNIVVNQMSGEGGVINLVDYMPILNPDGNRRKSDETILCRHIECVRGVDVQVELQFSPRPNYGQESLGFDFTPFGAVSKCGEFVLRSTHPIDWDKKRPGHGVLTLTHGDDARVVLFCRPDSIPRDLTVWTDKSHFNTRAYWEEWISRCLYKSKWRRMVERSALTLKLLTFRPTGAILAAPTASLPEGIGGNRNWDYRFSWLRDSALIINALFLLGYDEEATDFVRWMVSKRPAPGELMPVLYPIGDEDTTEERTLDHLRGYRNSPPVRIGNGARDQVQLDVYGEVLDALFLFGVYGGEIDDDIWGYVCDLAERICAEWHEKDEGIWEVRGGKRHFTYSKFMCWVGLDRASRMGADHGFEGPFERWQAVATEIREFVLTQCTDESGSYFVQAPDTDACDASNLLIPIVSFLAADDPLVDATLDRTLEQLTHDSLVYRYLTEDGLDGHEGTFNICTFWLVEALAMAGRTEEAQEIFNGILIRASHAGLYAEEIEARDGIALGNFPQAFSHVGLINAALTLAGNASK